MIIRQHIPTFVSFPEQRELVNAESLELVPFVARWKTEKGFHRFSVDPEYLGREEHLLLAEFDQGARWWVVGYLTEISRERVLELYPEWVG